MTAAEHEATGTPQPTPQVRMDAAVPPSAADEEGLAAPSAVDATRFAHASEAEMARILDFYDVRWEYEPTTFPILWNLDGDVVESFAPDFYLPDLGVFLEMTTLKQRLVRKKNRKLRRLRELYPDIRIKLFYARDFRAMMLKYGRLGLAESLSGTLGQVVPERAIAQDVVASPAEPAVGAAAVAAAPPPATIAQAASAEPSIADPATADPSTAGPQTGGQPPRPAAAPRARSSRRRRRAGNVAQARAEREAGA